MLHDLIERLTARRFGPRRQRHRRSRHIAFHRGLSRALQLESLEQRRLLAVISAVEDGNADAFLVRTNASTGIVEVLVNGVFAGNDPTVINGSADDDTLTIDYINGDPLSAIAGGLSFLGGLDAGAGDALAIIGSGTEDAVYTPSGSAGTQGNDGIITVDGGTLTFTGLEPVDMFAMATATLITPRNSNDTLTVANGTGFMLAGDAIRVSGRVGNSAVGALDGVPIETVAFGGNTEVIIDTSQLDTATGSDGDDRVTINSADNAHNNANLTIVTGQGDDDIDVNGNVMVAGDLSIQTHDIALGGQVSAGNVIDLDAGAGAIVDDLAGEAANITAASAALRAAGGIGDPDDIDTSIGTLAASNSAAGIQITNDGPLTVGSVAGLAGISGGVSISAFGTITVDEAIAATGAGSVSLSARGANTFDVIVNHTITTQEGDITVEADRHVDGIAAADITTSSGIVSLSASLGPSFFGGRLRYSGDIAYDTGELRTFSFQNSLIDGVISGSGQFRKGGDVQLQLQGSNTYSGDTLITDGFVIAENDNGLGFASAGTTVQNNTTLILDNVNVAEPVTLNGNGHPASFTFGALYLRDNSLHTGPITLATDSWIRFERASEVAGPIREIGGSRALTIEAASGALSRAILSNTNHTYTGSTTVTGDGTLYVTGATPAVSTVTVEPTATLGGTGTIGGPLIVQGTVVPGLSPGVLNTGDVDFQADSTFQVELGGITPGNGVGFHDQLNVTGTVRIGANVALDTSFFGGFVPTSGDTFTIIANDGTDAVAGTFAGLPDDSLFDVGNQLFAISYDFDDATGTDGAGNDVALFALGAAETEVSIDASGNLVITDINGGVSNDDLTIQSDTTNNQFILSDPLLALTTRIPTASRPNEHTVVVPFAAVTGSEVIVEALAGGDVLTVDFGRGNFADAITFNGGGQGAVGDSLVLTGGGTFANATYNFSNVLSGALENGTIDITGNQTIAYTGLEPIFDNLNVADRVFQFTDATAGGEVITLSDDGDPVNLSSQIDSTAGEIVTFTNPTTSLTIETALNGGSGTDTVNVEGLDSNFDANVTINADLDDEVNFQTNPTDIDTGNLMVFGNLVEVSSAVSAADILLTSIDVAGLGDDLTIAAGAGLTGSNVTLRGGDDVIIDSGSTIDAGGTLMIAGDFGDADPSMGSVIDILGTIITANRASVLGGADIDSITLNPDAGSSGGVLLDGQGGTDDYLVQLGNLGGQVDVDDQAGEGLDDLTINGTDNPETTTVTATSTSSGSETVTYTTELEFLAVQTFGGADTINVTPSADLEIDIFGGDPTAAPGDTLNFTTPASHTTTLSDLGPDNGKIEAVGTGNFLAVGFDGIEDVSVAGAITVTGGGLNDVLEITATSSDAGSFMLTSNLLPGPTVSFSSNDSFTFNAGNGNDELIVAHPAGSLFAPTGGIFYDGQGGSDEFDGLTLVDGSATTVTHTFADANNGAIDWDGTTLTYNGLEPITDNMSAANRVFQFTDPTTGGETITLADDDSPAANNISEIDSTAGEIVTFINPTASLTIQTATGGGDGTDVVNIEGLDDNFSADLTVNADDNDLINFQNTSTDIGTGSLDVTANAIDISVANITSGGDQIYFGPVTLSPATMLYGADIVFFHSTVANGGFNLTVDVTGDAGVANGEISGSGGLTKQGAGQWNLLVANTYAGVTNVSDGELWIFDGAGLGEADANSQTVVADGAQLYASGILIVNEHLSLMGELAVGTANSLVDWAGPVVVSGGNAILDPDSVFDTLIVSGQITGSGGFEKRGDGLLDLTGDNTYIGGTVVTRGTMLVNNTSGSGTGADTVTVQIGATLGGTGTVVGPVDVESGGTVAPGLSPGILNTGDVNFQDGSTFQVEIGGNTPGNGAGFHDQLNVTGTVSIQNNVRLVTSPFDDGTGADFVPTVGDQFVIIDNDGADAVTGAFVDLPEGAVIPNFLGSGLNLKISYMGGTGNDVVLTAALPDLTVVILEGSISENGGIANATVTRNSVPAGDLVVNLTSDMLGEAIVPSTVTILEGGDFAEFVITGVDDAVVDGTQTVTITASAAAHADGSDTVDVTDDDVPELTLTIVAASISEGDGPGATTATVSRNTDTTNALVVTLSSNDTSESTVPATVTIPAGQSSSLPFDIDAIDDAIVDGTQTVTITASAAAHADGSDTVDVTDDDVPELTLTIVAASISEAGGPGATTATVSRNTDTTNALVVTLSSNDTSESTVPATVTIPAGQSSSLPFDIDAIDDAIVDGTQTVTITASAAAHADGSDTVDVTDDDVPELTLTIVAASISEGDGPGATTATVSRNTDPTNALVITLDSSDTSEATVPATITIPAGQSTSLPFDIDAIDDAIVDGTQTVTITASAAAHADGSDTVDVTDDDVPELTLMIVAASISEGDGPGATTATVSRNTDTTNALVVTLSSDDTSESTVPATVTIPAGQSSSLPFDIDAIDDAIVDGTQTVTITASAAAHADGSDTVDVTDDDVPELTLTIVAASISEGDGPGATTATVSRNTDTTNALVVTLSSDDTSESTVPATVTIPAGQSSSLPFDIDAIDDAIVDGTQTVTITASAAAHADGSHTVDVTDDDVAELTLMIVAASISEGDGPGATTATVSRNTDPTNALVVTLASSDTSESTVPATVTIPAGQSTSLPFDIDAIDDAIVDGTQTVTISATAAGFSSSSDTIDIIDNDATTVSVVASDADASEDLSDAGPFTLTLDNGKLADAGGIVVNFTVNGTAMAGTDYTALPLSATIPAGQNSVTVDVTGIVDDLIVEGNETVVLTVTGTDNPNVGVNDTADSGTVTIGDNDTATFTISDVTVDEAAGTMTLTVSLDNPIDIPVVVDVTYTDVTATGATGGAGADYDNDADTLSFAALDTAGKMVTIAVTNDNIVELTETFTANLSTVTSLGTRASDLTDTGIGTITDNDTATFTINNQTVDEAAGTMTLTVSLDNPVDIPVVVDVAYTDVTATGASGGAAGDYDNRADTASFAALDSADKTVTIDITNDDLVEATETFTAALSTGTALDGRSADLTDTATGTITDNDSLLVEFSQSSAMDVESSGGNLPQLLVTGTIQGGHSVTIDAAAVGGTATGSGVDYNDPMTVTVAAGTYNATAVDIAGLSVTPDTLIEPDETIDLGTLTGSQIQVGDANDDETTQAATQYLIQDDEMPLTAVAVDNAASLTIRDFVPGGKDDQLELTIVGDRLVITDLNNLIGDFTDNTTGTVVDVPLATFLSVEIDLLGGDDQLSIDFSGAPQDFNLSLLLNGGEGIDTLTFTGPTPLGPGELATNDEVEDIFVNGPITTQGGTVTLNASRSLEVNSNINTGAGGKVRLTANEHDIFGNCSLIQAGAADVHLVAGTGIAGVRVQTTGDVTLDGGSGGIVGCTGELAVSGRTLTLIADASVGTALRIAGQTTLAEPFLTSVDAIRGIVGGLGIFLINDRALTDNVELVGLPPLGVRNVCAGSACGASEGEGSPLQNAVNRLDVNDDGAVSPVDALAVVNYLNGVAVNSEGPRSIREMLYVDVNGDYAVSPVDALAVINHLNGTHLLTPQGESTALGQVEIEMTEPPLHANFATASGSNFGRQDGQHILTIAAARHESNETQEWSSSPRSIPRAAQVEPEHRPKLRRVLPSQEADNELERLLSQIAPDVDAVWSTLDGTKAP